VGRCADYRFDTNIRVNLKKTTSFACKKVKMKMETKLHGTETVMSENMKNTSNFIKNRQEKANLK
jgi:hypothetical protein